MLSKKLRVILFPIVLLLLLFAASILLLNSLVQDPSVQRYLLGQLSRATGFQIETGRIEISFGDGVGITAHNLQAGSRRGGDRITASRIRITLDTGGLLRGRITPSKIHLSRPLIELTGKEFRPRSRIGSGQIPGETNFQMLAEIPAISLNGGNIRFKNLPFDLENVYLEATQKSRDDILLNVSLKAAITYGGEKLPFTLKGAVARYGTKNDPLAEITIKTGDMPLAGLRIPGFLFMENGRAKGEIKVRGPLGGPLSAKGRIVANELCCSLLKADRNKEFAFHRLGLDFEALYSDKAFKVSSLRLDGPDFVLAASGSLDLANGPDCRLTLKVESPYVDVTTFKKLFPAPLMRPWVDERLFPLLAAGSARLDLFSLNGTLSQIKNLKRPENAGCLMARISWKDLEVVEGSDTLPFERVSGKLSIEKGGCLVSGVSADFGGSTIRKASLETYRSIDGRVFYVAIDGRFDIHDLIQQMDMDMVPPDVQKWADGFDVLSGNLDASVKLAFEQGRDYPRITNSLLFFTDCSIIHKALILPLSIREAEFRIDDKERSRFRAAGLWGNSGFQGSGTLADHGETGNARLVARADINEIKGLFFEDSRLPILSTDLLTCNVTLSRSNDLWSCRGDVDLKGMGIKTDAFSVGPLGTGDSLIFNVDLRRGKTVSIKDLTFNLGESSLELTGFCDLGEKGRFGLEVSSGQFLLKDLGVRFKKTNCRGKGSLSCKLKAGGSYRNPLKTSITGEMEARDLCVVLDALPSQLTDGNFKIRFTGKEARIDSMNVRVGNSPLRATGLLRGWNGIQGEIAVNADFLDFSDFLTHRTGARRSDKKIEESAFMERSDVRLKVAALKGRWRELRCGPVESECILSSEAFHIERSVVQMEHGMLRVKGHVNWGEQPEMLFSTYVNLAGQPMNQVFDSLRVETVYVEGYLTFEGLLFLKGRDKRDLVSGLTGKANILLEKGTIRKSNLIFNVLHFLSLEKIFEERPADLSREGFYFETIRGHITLNNGVLKTNNIIMKSPVFNAAAKGKVDLSKEWVEFDLGTQPMGTIDSLVTRIPIVGYILTGEDKSLLIYYFRVEGPLGKPEVRYVPLKNLGNRIIGFFGRLFLTPGRLFEEISQTREETSKKGIPMPDKEW